MLVTDDIESDDIYHRGPGELNYRTMGCLSYTCSLVTGHLCYIHACMEVFQVSQSLNRFQHKPKHKISVSSIATSVTS